MGCLGRCKISFSFWNLKELSSCFDGAQERMTKLYNKLEDINDKIEKEQIRRRRVMKKLDKMEACEGSDEIDYYLASPFVKDPNYRNIGRMNQVQYNDSAPASALSS